MAEYANDVAERVQRLRKKAASRDARMTAVRYVRAGNAEMVFRGLFPSDWPKAVIANTINDAAQDAAMMIGVLPTLSAAGDSLLDESKRSRMDKLTRIINYHAYASSLGTQLVTAADKMISYGFVPFRVEPNYDEKRPHIHVDDPMGTYYDMDRFRRLRCYARVMRMLASDLAALFPEVAGLLIRRTAYGVNASDDEWLDVVQYWDEDRSILFVPKRNGLVLSQGENPLGRVPVRIAQVPSADDEDRGQFDDSLWVWAAKARLALLNLEAAQKAVEAPIAVPNDVQEFTFGPDAIMRSNSPERIRRVSLDVPNGSIFEMRQLDDELKLSTHYPDVRTGQTDASVVTGRGVQALLGGFDQRIKTSQSMLGATVADILSDSLEMDRKLFGDETKKVFADTNGSSFELTYNPGRDIISTHVSVEYGVMAGLDPNRALVWSLQAMSAGLISEAWVRRNLPVNINATEEEKMIDVERLRTAMLTSVQGYAQAIPQLATQGQDPMEIISRIASVIEDRKKGVQIEVAAATAFKPPEPDPNQMQPGMEQMMPGQPGMPGDPMDPMAAGAPGGDLAMPAQPPSMQQLLAQLPSGGDPRMSVRTVRQQLV